MRSKIETLILDQNFPYIQPWFYENPYALRCELGIGDSDYMQNAYRRANEIFFILFPDGQPDAVLFNQYVYEEPCTDICADQDRAFYELMTARRHVVVPNLLTYEDQEKQEKTYIRNRTVCYRDSNEFDVPSLLSGGIHVQTAEAGLVSFSNECILSIYDDRGCDVVFATQEKLREFYPKLEPYFLSYDVAEMNRRYLGK